jgi:hypothetical protein
MVWDSFPDTVEPPGGLPPTGLPPSLVIAPSLAPQNASHSPTDLGMGAAGTPTPPWPSDLPEQPVVSWGFAGPG